MFLTTEELTNHRKYIHDQQLKKVREKGTKTEEFINPAVKIPPYQDFLTKNTADLNSMLETIPENLLYIEEDVFEKDFKQVLHSVEYEPDLNTMKSYQCDECNFRGTSKKCLKAYVTFVHNQKFYKCPLCDLKTRTEATLNYHTVKKHSYEALS